MKREITYGQLLSVAVTILLSIGTGWLTMNNKQVEHERRISTLETEMYSFKLDIQKRLDKFEDKLDDVNAKLTDILVNLEKKENRK